MSSRSSGPRLYAGLDLGSTSIKLLVVDGDGVEVTVAHASTPWSVGARGATEIHADVLMTVIEGLLEKTARDLGEQHRTSRVLAIGIAGMGETGFVVDVEGTVVAPGFAWFDPRGSAQVRALPTAVQDEFAGRTGLPLGAQVTVAKLAHLRSEGISFDQCSWHNLPEFVAFRLGGDVAGEYSLTSRTGLLDQDTAAPWPEMLEALGIDESFVPPLRDAGASWGRARLDLPWPFAKTRLTVAGHDHLVAAEANGGLGTDEHHVSLGTAEVLLRVIDGPLGFEARTRLAKQLINEVRHIVPGKHVLVAGVKSGLLFRRLLQSVGITDRAGRDALDAAIMAMPLEGGIADGSIEISGARNDDGVMRLAVYADGVSPAEIFGAALRHSNDEIALLIAAMDREVGPAASSLLTGGWVGMQAVVRARAAVLPVLSVSARDDDTAYGAACIAMRMDSSTSDS